jgi:hypothetical protein
MLLNVNGADAPRTNVARSEIESGESKLRLVEVVYRAIVNSVQDSVVSMTNRNSLRFALSEGEYLYNHATRPEGFERQTALSEVTVMHRVLREEPLFFVDGPNFRGAKSCSQLLETGFRVIVGGAASDAARFLEWSTNDGNVVDLLDSAGVPLPGLVSDMPLLANLNSVFSYDELLWSNFEVSLIEVDDSGSNMVVTFKSRLDRWISLPLNDRALINASRSVEERLESSRIAYRANNVISMHCLVSVAESGWAINNSEAIDVYYLDKAALIDRNSDIGRLAVRLSLKQSTGQSDVRELAVLALIVRDFFGRVRTPRSTDVSDKLREVYINWLREYLPESDELDSMCGLIEAYMPSQVLSSREIASRYRFSNTANDFI